MNRKQALYMQEVIRGNLNRLSNVRGGWTCRWFGHWHVQALFIEDGIAIASKSQCKRCGHLLLGNSWSMPGSELSPLGVYRLSKWIASNRFAEGVSYRGGQSLNPDTDPDCINFAEW